MSQHLQSHTDVLTGARQTMTAWSKVIDSREDIPAIYKSHFDKYFDNETQFPYVIWTPSLEKFLRKTTEKLICDTADALHVFEKIGNHIDVKCYSYRDIYSSEVGIVLLDSWLTISGRTSLGEAATSKIEVNTTSMRYFAGILKKVRPSLDATDQKQFSMEKDKFNALSTVNFKFMNDGRDSLVPGETVTQIILQPEIRQPLWTIFGKTFYKTITPAHLMVLTDHELILLHDVERIKESKISRYGGVWQYIPMHCLDSVKLSSTGDEHLTLSIRCQPDQTIEKLFDASNQPELEKFCSQFQTMLAL
jgi:hypothetical protein